MEDGKTGTENHVYVQVTAAAPPRVFYYLAPSVEAAMDHVKNKPPYTGITGAELLPEDLFNGSRDPDTGLYIAVRVTRSHPLKTIGYFLSTSIDEALFEAIRHHKEDGVVQGEQITVNDIPRTPQAVAMSETRRMNKLDHALNWARTYHPTEDQKYCTYSVCGFEVID